MTTVLDTVSDQPKTPPVIYSELFRSIQGEGPYTGVPTMWVRLYGCNLQCDGFGQDIPEDPATHQLPYKLMDLDGFQSIEELPVFEYGCDSSYSWSARYKHLQKSKTVEEVSRWLSDNLPDRGWASTDLCFTGGEPFLDRNQKQISALLSYMVGRVPMPRRITFETNGTREMNPELRMVLNECRAAGAKIVIGISPKLYHVSGELPQKAINTRCISRLSLDSDDWFLKFVLNDRTEAWSQVDGILRKLSAGFYDQDRYEKELLDRVWIMPVGATVEGQEKTAAQVAERAISRGFNVSARVHSYIWGNVIGT